MSRRAWWGKSSLTPFFLLGFAALSPAWAASGVATRDETIALTLDSGTVVQATLRRPVHAKQRLPVVMLFGGFQGAAQVLELVHAPRPVMWATFDYPFEPPRKFVFPESLKYAPQLRQAVQDSFDGVVKLHAALRERPDVDPARITVVGASAGAPFALVGAERGNIPGTIVVQGFADVARVVHNLLMLELRDKHGPWISLPARALANLLVWYCDVPDLPAAGRRLRPDQHVLMITATADDYVPADVTEELWTALGKSKAKTERIDLPGQHLRGARDRERIAEMLQRSMKWMEQRGLL